MNEDGFQDNPSPARAGHFAAAVGILMPIAGARHLTNGLALVLGPALGARLFPAIFRVTSPRQS